MKLFASLPIAIVFTCSAASAQNVKIAPLGPDSGELGRRDRLNLFEDPTGVGIRYDAGHSVTGAENPRLGHVHLGPLSHAHGEPMGDRNLEAQNTGALEAPETVPAAPNSTTTEIAAAEDSAVVMMIPMTSFIGDKTENVKEKPTDACPMTGSDLVVPLLTARIACAHSGATRTGKTAGP